MKLTRFTVFVIFIFAISLASCIKEEGSYREADIENFTLPADIMQTSTVINYKDNNRVVITVYDTAGMKNAIIKPEIIVSAGAKVIPASGLEVQLENYQASYVVTAQSGSKKVYTITLKKDKPLEYNFESWYEVSNPKGTRIYDMLSDELWCNANKGVTMVYRDSTLFPTRRTTDSHSGKYGILLETVFGNRSILHIMDIPLYAGSAFRGVFETNMSNPVTSAKFGQTHAKNAGKPIRFTGWYKYKSGEYYQTCTVVDKPKKHNEVDTIPGKKDELDIYAVMFKVPQGNDGKKVYLTAENVLTSERLIATAVISDRTEKDDWTRFDIPFTYTEGIDYSQFDYKLAIVLSSSKRGAFYEGAIGSLLVVDEIEIETEPIH